MSGKDNTGTLKAAVGVLGLSTVALLASTIGLAVKENNAAPAAPAAPAADTMSAVAAAPSTTDFVALKENSIFLDYRDNVCAGAQLAVANKLCADLEVPTPQAGGNVTKGYVGDLDVGSLKPHTDTYFQGDMCPVNVHWHLGTEHYSYGQYDENGNGPHGTAERPEWANRDLAAAGEKKDEKFTEPMTGSTVPTWKSERPTKFTGPTPPLEIAALSTSTRLPSTMECSATFYGTIRGYCRGCSEYCQQRWCSRSSLHCSERRTILLPDMMRGMIIDKQRNMGTDIHYYTGSTTGTSRSNEMCSQYAPITWQVDRQCHMISASSFDKLCHDMLLQRDDMKDDLYPHGSRELVMDSLVANNAADAESLAAAAAAAAAPAAEAAPEEAPAAEEALPLRRLLPRLPVTETSVRKHSLSDS
ncbi:hypothetical protein QTG54_003645 [Skeletonema marinoi]|uniref:Uncharacterized protein n=2 Tax=Coscinodiscophyceae TaxID=33836 RepID=A0AAD9DFF7_9STRA|nr:hypothetical protein QTG54_003645 [Skeletonema marinoi]